MLRTHRIGPFGYLIILTTAIIALALLPRAVAFGAGNIPSYSHQEGRAFRHGDLADALSALYKKSGGGMFSGKSKWSGLDIKRCYFGNWLRDYSQAMDVAGLQKLSKQTILSIVMVLSFLAHGYATGEFEVTDERLGVYLPTEHLDNPKGYPSNAKQYDSRLRGPVDPEELEIDPRSGMKNYLANESGTWATSSRLIRETVCRVVQLGREARQSGRKETLFEAYQHLGKVMHCLEDFPAHSNFCELALLKIGYGQVFCHVGDNVKVRSPSGDMVPCLVTGSFGGMDFVASMLGETSDHLSSASVSDLSKTMNDAKKQQTQGGALSSLMSVLNKLPTSVGGDVSRDAEALSRGPSTDPNNMSPQEIYSGLFRIFTFHDKVMMGVESTIEKIPGLESLLDTISTSLASFTMSLIEPFAKPLISSALSGLQATSGAVVSGVDQYEVFNDPNASDPTHTQLAKDHFNLILNEVAGNVAIIIDRHVVNTIVSSWDDSRDPREIADECLAPLFHPHWQHPRSAVQAEMLDYVASWARNHQSDIHRLTKEHCRAHTNTRDGRVESHQGCGGGSLPGASQQSVGFGPALANWVGGKVGLPTGGGSGAYGSFIGREGEANGSMPTSTAEGGHSGSTEDSYPQSAEGRHQEDRHHAAKHPISSYERPNAPFPTADYLGDRMQGSHDRPQRGPPPQHGASPHHQWAPSSNDPQCYGQAAPYGMPYGGGRGDESLPGVGRAGFGPSYNSGPGNWERGYGGGGGGNGRFPGESASQNPSEAGQGGYGPPVGQNYDQRHPQGRAPYYQGRGGDPEEPRSYDRY